jgi:predicted peptidase
VNQTWQLAAGQHPQSFRASVTKTVAAQFLLYLPQDFAREPNRRWPLIVFLHGSGERGDDLDKVKVHGPPKLVLTQPDFPFIVASPQAPKDGGWDTATLNALLDELLLRLPVDADRVYLTGLSMGGHGTWRWATEHPERFAAIVPISGAGDEHRVCALKHLPVWAFHGEADDVVSVKGDQITVDALKACDGDVRFTVYPGVGHDAWTATYANAELYRWLLQHRRRPIAKAAAS